MLCIGLRYKETIVFEERSSGKKLATISVERKNGLKQLAIDAVQEVFVKRVPREDAENKQ